MTFEPEQVLLRMHMSNFLKWHASPLFEAVVGRARHEHLAGATVLLGCYGYLGRGLLIGDHPHVLQVERPVVIECVDREDALQRFLATVEPMLHGKNVLVTWERAQVVPVGGAGESAS